MPGIRRGPPCFAGIESSPRRKKAHGARQGGKWRSRCCRSRAGGRRWEGPAGGRPGPEGVKNRGKIRGTLFFSPQLSAPLPPNLNVSYLNGVKAGGLGGLGGRGGALGAAPEAQSRVPFLLSPLALPLCSRRSAHASEKSEALVCAVPIPKAFGTGSRASAGSISMLLLSSKKVSQILKISCRILVVSFWAQAPPTPPKTPPVCLKIL